MTLVKKTYPIKKQDFNSAGEASISVKNLLKSINIDKSIIRKVAVCGYEGEMNVVMHGGDGLLVFLIENNKISLDISDNGEGIEDTELALKKGYSTATEKWQERGFGAGMGLPNMKKNADTFLLESKPGEGTRVYMTFTIKTGSSS